mmetsp:Transcript_343/g.947  ORF Transcript_343/g.947 Transcript_343/m.947 type:complete len:94 (+) Transcript_343:271-552(+)
MSADFKPLTTQAVTMSTPPTTSFDPKLSPSNPAANKAAHMGSVAKMTDACAEGTRLSAFISMRKDSAVDTNPVQAMAQAAVRRLGSKKMPGRV